MKNKFFKKLVTVMLVASMAAGMVGCGTETGKKESDEANVSKEESKTSEVSQEIIAKDEEPVHLRWYMYGPEKPGLAEVNEKMSEYTLEKIGCTVELINIPTDYSTKMRLLIAGGADIDIMFTSNDNAFYEFASQGVFLEIDDLLDEYGQGIKEILPEYFYESAKLNGNLYAIPSYKDAATDFVLRYNIQEGEKYAVNPDEIKNLADLEPYLKEWKKDHPDNYPLMINAFDTKYLIHGLDIMPLAYDYSLCIFVDKEDPNTLFNPYETDEMMEHLRMMYDWFLKGYTKKDLATNWDYYTPYLFTIGAVLPYQTEVENMSRTDEEKMADIHWRQPILHSTAPSMNAITANCENPEKAMEFLNLVNTDVYLKNLVTFGIEGKHFVKVSDTRYKLPDGVTAADLDYSSYQYTLGNTYINYRLEGTPDDIEEKYQEFDNNSYKSPTFGFYLDDTDIATELAAVKAVYVEYYKSLFSGAIDPDVYMPEFLDKLKAAGYDKVLAEAQKQFDEWRANK